MCGLLQDEPQRLLVQPADLQATSVRVYSMGPDLQKFIAFTFQEARALSDVKKGGKLLAELRALVSVGS